MNVIVARSAGFCWGVRRAVEKARAVAVEAAARGNPVLTDGPLIHNEQMMGRLADEGIRQAESLDEARGKTLIVRAHGIPPDRRREIEACGCNMVDATCPDVARIQGQIRRHARKGFRILIYGDPGHAEVIGLLGFAEGRGLVLGSHADVDALPDMEQVCLVSQSTQFPAAFVELASAVRRRFPHAVVLDTICVSTRNRQEELCDMARRVDAFVVVGGAHSANTVRLFDLARSLKPAFLVQTDKQIDIAALAVYRTVGLTAGASTPEHVIEAVRRALVSI